MTTTTMTELGARPATRRQSMFRTAYDRVIEARERQARRYVASVLNLVDADGRPASDFERNSLFEPRLPERN
ncbi:hypothetical protein [Mangrovicella endophytica]|uniref:hypothetical protein n=1 Tax=Mangrovicella endophytica TaxID=2066697 RepID=UPI000C9E5B4E|nr:hypothetical protein [Mangrovicella endophytica]